MSDDQRRQDEEDFDREIERDRVIALIARENPPLGPPSTLGQWIAVILAYEWWVLHMEVPSCRMVDNPFGGGWRPWIGPLARKPYGGSAD